MLSFSYYYCLETLKLPQFVWVACNPKISVPAASKEGLLISRLLMVVILLLWL